MSARSASNPKHLTRSSSAPGLVVSTRSIVCANSVSKYVPSRQVVGLAALGTGTATRGVAATWKASSTRIPSRTKGSNETAAEFVRRKIRTTVKDPRTAELLCPNDHPIGTKRLILDTDYYETYNRDNVTLVDIRSKPIKEITPTGLSTTDTEYALDAIVFATGFDAMTGAMKEIDIHTDAGVSIGEKWEYGPRTTWGS